MRTTSLVLAGAAIGSVVTLLSIGVAGRVGDLALSPEQKAVRDWLLEDANEPESLWIERWGKVERIEPSRIGYRNSGKYIDDNNVGICDRTLEVLYRENVPIRGRVQQERKFYLDGSKVLGTDSTDFVVCTVAEDQRRIAYIKSHPNEQYPMLTTKDYMLYGDMVGKWWRK